MSIFAKASIPPQNYNTTIHTARHEFLADEDKETGGQDSGPAPREMLLGSLAACTAITLKMYIQHKQWSIQDVDVHVELIEGPDKKTDPIIKRTLKFKAGVETEQMERLVKVANSCPVHKLLSASLVVETVAAP